jgi:hypothetical protein
VRKELRVRSIEEAELHIRSLTTRIELAEHALSDHGQRFDTLQTSLRQRLLFRLDGWPGTRNLNADRPAWRPWRKWWTS